MRLVFRERGFCFVFNHVTAAALVRTRILLVFTFGKWSINILIFRTACILGGASLLTCMHRAEQKQLVCAQSLWNGGYHNRSKAHTRNGKSKDYDNCWSWSYDPVPVSAPKREYQSNLLLKIINGVLIFSSRWDSSRLLLRSPSTLRPSCDWRFTAANDDPIV